MCELFWKIFFCGFCSVVWLLSCIVEFEVDKCGWLCVFVRIGIVVGWFFVEFLGLFFLIGMKV